MPESQKDEFDEQNTDTSDRSLEVSNTGLNPTPGVTICILTADNCYILTNYQDNYI